MPFFFLQSNLKDFFFINIFTVSVLYQSICIFLGLVIAYSTSVLLQKMPAKHFSMKRSSQRLQSILQITIFPFVWMLNQWTIVAACGEFQWNYSLNHAAAEFITAWFVIRCFHLVILQASVRKLIAFLIFAITALDVVGLLCYLKNITENFALTIGDLKISFLSVLKGGIIFIGLIWATIVVSRWVEQKLKSSGKIEPSLQELFTKLIWIFFLAFSVLITLSSMGLNLSALAVFGGAIGVGIGFGLQKVLSNLFCGILLLLDRSIKPGDVIALENGQSYGEIIRLGARYVLVRTRSGKEHFIPNEEFIVNKSENWSHTDSLVRLHIPMRVSLDSDVPLVMRLLVQSAEGIDRVLEDPMPAARLLAFTESAIEFDLRVWINDPRNGISKVKSDIYINIWKLFKEKGVVIPLPQRELLFSQVPQEKFSNLKNSFVEHMFETITH